MDTPCSTLARRIAAQYGRLPPVEAVALAGSQTTSAADAGSDIDLYVYLRQELSVDDRRTLVDAFADVAELDNRYWEPGDEWIDAGTGVHVDVMFRDMRWIEDQLARVVERGEASVGYSTCFWHNLLTSQALFDRHGWFAGLQDAARRPYPAALRQAIVASNFPILRNTLSSYRYQLERALGRGDAVSVNHRVAAVLASYFDILFAVNRLPHPGEKRLLALAELHCENRPRAMREDVERVLGAAAAPGPELLSRLDRLIDGLEEVLRREGLIA